MSRTILLPAQPYFISAFETDEVKHASSLIFRQAAARFATGVAVLTAFDSHREVCGMTVNSFVTVSLSPPTVLVSVKPGRVHRAISESRRYGVNVLPEDGWPLSAHFAGRPTADANPAHELVEGLPRLIGAVAFFACEVSRSVEVSDHTLFIAEVSNCNYSQGSPLVFFSSRYHLGPGPPLGADRATGEPGAADVPQSPAS
jgi:flavin reductase